MTDDEIALFKGENKQLNTTINNDDGQALDLKQADSVELIVAEQQALNPNYSEGDILFTVNGSNLDSNGNAEFQISTTDSDQEPGLYVYQIKVVFPNDEYTAVTGSFFIKQDIE